MKAVTVSAIILAAVASGGAARSQDISTTQSWKRHQQRRADPNKGRFVAIGGEFGELRFACSSCHGFKGQGDPSGAFPRLAGQSAWYLHTSLQAFANGTRTSGIMGRVAAELSDDDMLDVAAYYASLENVPYPPELQHSPAQVLKGRDIVASGVPEAGVPACSLCHGETGRGVAPFYPYVAGQFQPYLKQQLHLFKAGKRGGDPLNVMHQIASRLTDDQIEAVSVYLASLQPKRTTPNDVARQSAGKPPEPLPMMTGAVMHPRIGKGDVVVPNASVPKPSATPRQTPAGNGSGSRAGSSGQ